MLEIILLYFLCKNMGERLRAKGWTKPLWMQIAVVLVWFGCMFFGSLTYGVYVAIKEGEAAAQDIGFSAYPIALLSGAAGVGILFLIAGLIPNKSQPPTLNEGRV